MVIRWACLGEASFDWQTRSWLIWPSGTIEFCVFTINVRKRARVISETLYVVQLIIFERTNRELSKSSWSLLTALPKLNRNSLHALFGRAQYFDTFCIIFCTQTTFTSLKVASQVVLFDFWSLLAHELSNPLSAYIWHLRTDQERTDSSKPCIGDFVGIRFQPCAYGLESSFLLNQTPWYDIISYQ